MARSSPWSRLVLTLGVVTGVVFLAVDPAAADPARPTNFRSEIDSATPALPDGVSVRVIGGDSFLELSVAKGHTATVRDYGDDPDRPIYLEFLADGTVRRNESSSAATLNSSRYGTRAPAASGEGATPRWKVVSRSGTYAWHDHRIHWMAKSAPPLMADGKQVDLGHPDGSGDWTVPIEVDGHDVELRGRLYQLAAPSVLPWVLIAAVAGGAILAAAAVAFVRGSTPPHRVFAVALVGVAALATAAGTAEWRAIPADAGGTALSAVIPAVGLLAAITAVAAAKVRLMAAAAAVAALLGWGVWRRDVLSHAVLPTSAPILDRWSTALCFGVGVAVAIVLVWQPPRPPRANAVRSVPSHA